MIKIIKIEGMSCMHCVNHVKNALTDIAGVKSVEVDLKAKSAKVQLEGVSDDELKNAIEDAGYEVVGIEEN
ncbi:hypothetical protein Q428_12100 [Fervidicella metallireducens AeB]|uniref:Copper chaperone CopZ n=1 Tax=Fervidicella metallireducens AeB TaxID=1403537 RepID=A0A017RUT6_9CLOT|nr:copper ion binding protein [Fervidicella metallireducens]EYE87650.1 hypothetical protein Q428_12100 [Fervidicella metallireducens AeB]